MMSWGFASAILSASCLPVFELFSVGD